MHQFTQFITQQIPANWKHSSGGWISGNCPACIHNGEPRPDTKKRGGFLIENDNVHYHCFNCNYNCGWNPTTKITKTLENLLVYFGADRAEIKRFALRLFVTKHDNDGNEIPVIPFQKPEWKKIIQGWNEIQLPQGSKELFLIDDIKTNTPQYNALAYIVNRDLHFYTDWFYSDHYSIKNRLILPLRYNRAIVGYAARWLGDSKPNTPKYLINVPKDYIFNLDNQTKSKKIVFVTEGFMDALMVDGIAIGSNQLSQTQADIIESLGKKVIVLPDKNKAGKRLVDTAIDRGWSISFPPWEDGIIDVNDSVLKYGRLFTVYSALQATVDNTLKAKIQAQLWCR